MNFYFYCLTLLIFILPSFSAEGDSFIKIRWGKEIHYKTTETGEILSINGVFFKDSTLYLYDLAGKSLLLFTRTGSLNQRIALESIGRNSYVGDDFVIIDNHAVFLNTVDRRLEVFDLATGKNIKSIKYPYNHLSSKRKRRFQIINKIFIDKNMLLLGNSHALFYFNPATGEVMPDRETITCSDGCRILFYNGTDTLSQCNDTIAYCGNKYKSGKEVFPVSGKQYFIMNKKVYQLRPDFKGIFISELEKIN